MELTVRYRRRYGSMRNVSTAPKPPWSERRVLIPLDEAVQRLRWPHPVRPDERWRVPGGSPRERVEAMISYYAGVLIERGLLAPQPVTFEIVGSGDLQACVPEREAHIVVGRATIEEPGMERLMLHEMLHLGQHATRTRKEAELGSTLIEATTDLLTFAVHQELFGPLSPGEAVVPGYYREVLALPVLYHVVAGPGSGPEAFGQWLLRVHRNEPGVVADIERQVEANVPKEARAVITDIVAAHQREAETQTLHADDYHGLCMHTLTDGLLGVLGNAYFHYGMEPQPELAALRRWMRIPLPDDATMMQAPLMLHYVLALTRPGILGGSGKMIRADRRWSTIGADVLKGPDEDIAALARITADPPAPSGGRGRGRRR